MNASDARKTGWRCGVKDALRVIEDRKRFLNSLRPTVQAKPGVIEILDEVATLCEAMLERGCYSSSSYLDS